MVVQRERKKGVQGSRMYIPCQWSSSRYACPAKKFPGPDFFRLKLATGKMPFHEYLDVKLVMRVLKGERPRKPHHFEAEGITSDVWKVAKKCWNEKAVGRPEVKEVLQSLEKIANPGVWANNACTFSPREFVD